MTVNFFFNSSLDLELNQRMNDGEWGIHEFCLGILELCVRMKYAKKQSHMSIYIEPSLQQNYSKSVVSAHFSPKTTYVHTQETRKAVGIIHFSVGTREEKVWC